MKEYMRDLFQIEDGTLEIETLAPDQIERLLKQVYEEREQLESKLNYYVTRAYTVYSHEKLTETDRLNRMSDVINKLKDCLFHESKLNLLLKIVGGGKLNIMQQAAVTAETVAAGDQIFDAASLNSANANRNTHEAHVTEQTADDEQTKKQNEPTYVFERKLRGGFVTGLESYLPESIVKEHGFEHGDLVYVEQEYTNAKGEARYEFSLAKKRAKPFPRIELHKCMLRRENSFLVTDTYFCMQDACEKLIKIDEVPYTFVISDDEAMEWKVEDGDIVDIAYYESDPTKVKIIYKHYTESDYTQPQKSSVYKEPSKSEDAEEFDTLDDAEIKQLTGKTIAVVGSDYRFPDYAQASEKIGVRFIGIAGDAYKAVPGLVRDITDADVVVLMIHAMRHQTSTTVVQTCKEQGKPFAESRSFGIKSMFRAALAALDKTKPTKD